MRIFEEISKAKNPDRIHPSDKKYNEGLKKRQALAGDSPSHPCARDIPFILNIKKAAL
jgi:hypothetical protein